jgi:hypothetical protein
MSASAAGQFMIADVPRVVNPEMPPLAIELGRANGWNPLKSAPPFRVKHPKGKSVPVENGSPPTAKNGRFSTRDDLNGSRRDGPPW